MHRFEHNSRYLINYKQIGAGHDMNSREAFELNININKKRELCTNWAFVLMTSYLYADVGMYIHMYIYAFDINKNEIIIK